MDRSLDEIVAERQRANNRPPRRAPLGPRRGNQNSYPRDGVRKVRILLSSSMVSSLLSCDRVAESDFDSSSHGGSRMPNRRHLCTTRDDRPNLDNDWTHDRFDEEINTRSEYPSRGRRDEYNDRGSLERDRAPPPPAKLRVDNLHYDLTEDEIYDLFTRIAPVEHASLRYDRAGRSEGIAFVTYANVADARTAIAEFDGANAKGQPIRLTLLPLGPSTSSHGTSRRDNPFDRIENPRSLFDRIEPPRTRRRSESPIADDDRSDSRRRAPRRVGGGGGAGGRLSSDRRSDTTKPPPENIDRYVPGQSSNGRSPRRNGGGGGGRRPGERRERDRDSGRGSGRENGGTRMVNGRPRKTQEELDAEMDDYWGNSNTAKGDEGGKETGVAPAATELDDDIDMIE